MRTDTERYATGSIILHWLIAINTLGLLASGLWMVGAIEVPGLMAIAFETYQLHKAFGVLVLLLTIVRIGWRLGARAPAPSATLGPMARRFAGGAHAALYILMLAVPLTGWLLVSASPLGLATSLFGVIDWPRLPVIAAADLETQAKAAHRWSSYLFGALVAVHVAAALKHQFIDRDGLIGRMWPFPTRRLNSGSNP